MDAIRIGGIKLSRFIIGSNPFSGFSHQTPETDLAMKRYYTAERIKRTLREAEALGIDTVLGRVDHHMARLLLEYWDAGGTLQWFAQTCPEVGNHQACVDRAAAGGAKACHIHGGVMDVLLAQKRLAEVAPVIARIRGCGLLAGIAGHNPAVFEWAEREVDVDYYLCSYYNSAHRDVKAEHVSGMKEWFLEDDRRRMCALIQSLSRPVIHYKVLAAGRNDPAQAFEVVARSMRSTDAVCVGVYTQFKPDMLQEDVRLFTQALKARSKG
jgi:hypothetical protein